MRQHVGLRARYGDRRAHFVRGGLDKEALAVELLEQLRAQAIQGLGQRLQFTMTHRVRTS